MKKYIILGTPKAIHNVLKKLDTIDPLKQKLGEAGFRFEATCLIYINMGGGWTEEECDNVLYCVEDKLSMEPIQFKPRQIE